MKKENFNQTNQTQNNIQLQLSSTRNYWKITSIALVIVFLLIGGAYFVVIKKDSREKSKESLKITESQVSAGSEQDASVPGSQVLKQSVYQETSVASPDKFGFTKIMEMKGIGVKAKFPQDVNVSLQQENFYVAKVGSNDTVTFALKDYDGTGRRTWFQKEYKYYKDYAFSPFNGVNHSGYIAHAKTSDNKYPGGYFYFTAINSRKILVIDGFNIINGTIFFGGNLDKFKSFLSTVELTTTQNIVLEDPKASDLYRWSDKRKVVWEDANLGLKITAPEWIESRGTTERDIEGKLIYTDWIKTYSEAKTYDSSYFSETIKRVDVIGKYLSILPSKYDSKSFSDITSELLLPAGFCTTEWKNSKAECTGTEYSCYTRDEVIQNLIVKKQVKIGSLDAQLRNMNEGFSSTHDCRSEDTWLIKGRNGWYIISNIFPDSETIRIEEL